MRLRLIIALATVFWPATSASGQSAASPASGVDWMPFQEGLATSHDRPSKLLVDVYAPWCGWCSRLQSEVYTDKTVQAYLRKHFTVTRLNIDETEDSLTFKGYGLSSAELAMGLGASGTPTTVFIDARGEYITRLPGFLPAEEFLTVLKFVATDAYQSKSFDEFARLQKTSAPSGGM